MPKELLEKAVSIKAITCSTVNLEGIVNSLEREISSLIGTNGNVHSYSLQTTTTGA